MQDLTRNRILQAAEALFAEQGFGSTSLRAITARADVNLAAVNYHFGTKHALIQEIFRRRLEPLNRERLARLVAIEADGTPGAGTPGAGTPGAGTPGAGTPGVEAILEAYLAPTLKTDAQAGPGELRFMRLLGRTQVGAAASLREFVHGLYAEVLDRFAGALSRALPELPRTELYWRLHFLTGVAAYSMAAGDAQKLFAPCQLPEAGDNAALLGRLIPFLAAGLRAPLRAPATSGRVSTSN